MTVAGALRAATIALFATAALSAAPSVARAQDITCERGDLEVRGLEFRANRAISDDDLALRVAITPSSRVRRTLHLPIGEKRCLNRAELPRDVARLDDYYRDRGYYAAQIDTVVQAIGDDAVRVTFVIDEGEPTRVRSYTVTGLDSITEGNDILRRLRLRVGDPFDVGLFVADIDTIITRLRNAGYYRANQVRGHDIDTTANGGADAFIEVFPGRRSTFGSPVFDITPVEGRDVQIDTSVVRRVLGIQTGSRYSDRAIVEAQRNLFQLGTYRHVEVAPLPDSLQLLGDTVVILGVRLTEDYMRQLDSEFGWATLDCGRVRLQYTDKNLFGTARRLELLGSASKIGYGEPLATSGTRDACTFGGQSELAEDIFSDSLYYYTGIALRQPRLLGTRWMPTFSLYSERRGEFKAFMRSTPIGADVSATRELGDRTPLRLGYTFEYGKTQASEAAFCALFNRCIRETRGTIQELLPLGVASATLSRTRTDNPISPTRGTLVRAQFRTSASPLLGTSDSLFFNKATGDVAWYTTVSAGNVLTARLRGGVVLGQQLSFSDPTTFVPPQERLYAGGPTSVRGFQQNELGAVVYIARTSDVRIETTVSGSDTTFHFEAAAPPGQEIAPERAVPLGGNSLIVANLEYRIRDPFLAPNLLQYTFFVDGGAVGPREIRLKDLRWTPGFGVRALTPIGPVQVNVGYNGYQRENGPLFYNPDVNSLACATPGNQLTYRRDPTRNNELVEISGGACVPFAPPARTRFLQRLTFTFSIGPDF